ncbi:outer membrane protein W precursor [mine drainage metagenome]|uniref:Outer membrane protein W n=1 Tax=mine drainage metagenome TaxID=410659 RepID=A0A1J5RX31_9ZZZZ
MKSVKLLCLTSAVALFAGITAANAADDTVGVGAGDILVHARAVAVMPQEYGHDGVTNGSVNLGNDYIPELDASYFLTDHLAVEAIAGTSRDKVTLHGAANLDLGSVWLLPPTVTLQYHPLAHNKFDPYVGAGLNYTFFYGSSNCDTRGVTGTSCQVDYKNGVGYALQAGVNYEVAQNWFLNLDVKYIDLHTTADVQSGNLHDTARVAIDPILLGVGVGYRF